MGGSQNLLREMSRKKGTNSSIWQNKRKKEILWNWKSIVLKNGNKVKV